ncbi:MAG: hypothetical protein KME06_21195 [Kastovskya adunca ATA6-11-RM4]|jgi:hypothetical protein|nr:hypothetical protein [Kastovskya adunca ATA6-11-RM4]
MNNTHANSQDKTTKPSGQRTIIIPSYPDEDPERTPERWWARRQQQSLTWL